MSKATCRTCGASGPPFNHLPSPLDPDGYGDSGHRMNPAPTNKLDDGELRGDLRRYLEIGIFPLLEVLGIKVEDTDTERLIQAIIKADMMAIDKYVATSQATLLREIIGKARICADCVHEDEDLNAVPYVPVTLLNQYLSPLEGEGESK